ncbi:helix-turn-helix domain-containing protein [Brooklawnia cerclae]|uniref:DNA-binding XRE family transcriptional regulator n=1 Tax=Brooklawnia cerclae TaxID=349934 RepID=A0ABX0SM89_9ACTN|nr:DNA-binding XRE family transcriptional regulator [Brooklawnia cerclae]
MAERSLAVVGPASPGTTVPISKPADATPPEPLWRRLVGDQLRGTRRERGETLDDVADRAGVSPQYLSEIERGLKEPSSEVIAAVTGALGLTLLDLTLAVADTLTISGARSVTGPACFVGLALAA